MADVTGSIGNQPVILNNAATEATLEKLLSAITGQSGPAAAARAAQVAATAGINNANTQLQNLANTTSQAQKAGEKLGKGLGYAHTAADSLAESFIKADKAVGAFAGKLINGTAAVSEFYGALTQLPGVLGTVASVFQKVAEFQESNLSSYQQLTNAGVNFGGSLTQLRQAALNTYMSFDDFTRLMKDNGDSLSRLGGSANQGAVAFTKLSNTLLKSETGDDLRALGYTTSQLNQGMLDYIRLTGGRTREELKNSREVLDGSQRYLEQLDRLADVTGQSREQLAQDLKRKQEEADIEIMKANMTVKEREAFNAALNTYGALYGKAGQDMVVAAAQGRAVNTAEGMKLAALAPNLMDKINQAYQTNLTYGAESKQALDLEKESRLAAQQDLRKFGGAVATVGGLTKGVEKAFITSAKDIQAGNDTRTELDKKEAERIEEVAKRKQSEAKAAVEAEKAIQEMGQSLMAMLMPAIKLLTPVVNGLVGMFSSLTTVLAEYKTVTIGLVAALGVYLATQKIIVAKEALKAAQRSGAGLRGTIGTVASAVLGGGGLGALGSSSKNPLFVTIVGSMLPGGGLPGSPGGPPLPPGGQPGAPGQRPVPANREERLRRVQEGRAAQQAARAGAALKIGGIVGALASAGTLLSEFSDIDKKAEERAKEVGKEQAEAEAKKEKLSVGGETAGGLAGGLAGGKLGAMIGTAILPGVGTAIGGAIGGIAGGLLGAWGGSKAGEAMAGSNDLPKMAQGGIVTEPTKVLAGEAGPEAIIPLKHFESLRAELEMLNKQSAEMIKYMRDTAEYTKRTVDATKSLNGDLFKF